jgi:hypothetical protein
VFYVCDESYRIMTRSAHFNLNEGLSINRVEVSDKIKTSSDLVSPKVLPGFTRRLGVSGNGYASHCGKE